MPFILEGENSGGSSVNQVPVALGEVVTAITNTALRFPLASFDSDGTVSAPTITQPANGTVTIVSGNVIEYTPDLDYVGVDEFTFTVADNDGDVSGDGVISVNVIETPTDLVEPPVWVAGNTSSVVRWQVGSRIYRMRLIDTTKDPSINPAARDDGDVNAAICGQQQIYRSR